MGVYRGNGKECGNYYTPKKELQKTSEACFDCAAHGHMGITRQNH